MRSQKFIGIMLIGSFLVVLALFLPSLVHSVVFPSREKGTCFFLNPNICDSLSTTEIERVFAIDLGEHTEVLDSGSWRTLKTGETWAVVELKQDEDETHMLHGYDTGVAHGIGHTARERHKRGIEQVSTVLVNRDIQTTAYVGTGTADRRVIYFLKPWDG